MYLKKILIDATGIVAIPTGVGKYSYYLLRALTREKNRYFHFTILHQSGLPENHPLFLLRGEGVEFIPIGIPVVGPLRDVGLFKIKKLINGHALLHCLHTYLPAFGIKIPCIVTIHDLKYLLFPDFFDNRLKPLYYNWSIHRGIHKAFRVIAVSEATKSDLVKLTGVSSEKIVVIHEAATIDSSNTEIVTKLPDVIAGKPFLFFVGRNRPAKNVSKIIKAHSMVLNKLGARCPFFVFAGSDFDGLRQQHAGKEQSRKLFFLGPVSDEMLVNLYRHTIALVYPSLYEGFGLPILEAMAMGVPVITSNCSSIPEVAGQSAILIDPHNVDQLADAMMRILQNKDERLRLKQLGLRRAKRFSWENAARTTLDLYEDILSKIDS